MWVCYKILQNNEELHGNSEKRKRVCSQKETWRMGEVQDWTTIGQPPRQVSTIMQPHPVNKETRCIAGAGRKTVLIRGHLLFVCMYVPRHATVMCVCAYADDGCGSIIRIDRTG